MQMIKEYIIENKKKVIIIVILILLLLVMTFYVNYSGKNKIYVSEKYVYTKEIYNHDFGLTSKLPYINLKGDAVSDINDDLINIYYEVTTTDREVMNYDVYDNGDINSLVVSVYDVEAVDAYPTKMLFYNIDIKNGVIFDNETLMKKFDVSNSDVVGTIRKGLQDYYDYALNMGYIAREVDFDSFLSDVEAIPIDRYNLYVSNGALYAYKSVKLNSSFFYDNNCMFDLFNFKIKAG